MSLNCLANVAALESVEEIDVLFRAMCRQDVDWKCSWLSGGLLALLGRIRYAKSVTSAIRHAHLHHVHVHVHRLDLGQSE